MLTIKEIDIIENWYEMLFADGKVIKKDEGKLMDKLMFYREFLEDLSLEDFLDTKHLHFQNNKYYSHYDPQFYQSIQKGQNYYLEIHCLP